jgi:hypothetical protein
MKEIGANQFPFRREHIKYIAIELGPDAADSVVAMHQEQIDGGGINPAAVNVVFPEGPEGKICLNELQRVVRHHQIWREL